MQSTSIGGPSSNASRAARGTGGQTTTSGQVPVMQPQPKAPKTSRHRLAHRLGRWRQELTASSETRGGRSPFDMEADSISAGLSSAVAGVAGRMLLGAARALLSEPVPQLIHRFWSDRKIGDAELRSVVLTALQAQDYTTLLHTTDPGSVRTVLDTMDLPAGVRNRIQIHPVDALF